MNNEQYSIDDMESFPYAKVSLNSKSGEERRHYHKEDIWELDLSSLIQQINPTDYFCTTGEAVVKMKKLEADLFAAAGVARKLGNILKKLRNDNVYLETQWVDGRLILKTKNPRKNRDEKIKALEENFIYGRKK